jgi:hypothetical protein
LHLYFQNSIVMEEIEIIENGEDPNSLYTYKFLA